jgi:hypothetical protein
VLFYVDPGERKGRSEGPQNLWCDRVEGCRTREADGQDALLAAVETAHASNRLCGPIKDPAGILQEDFSGWAELDPFRGSVEELYLQFRFEVTDLLPQGRLLNAKLLSRLGDASKLCHRHKVAQMP